jgi:hypothetical protein
VGPCYLMEGRMDHADQLAWCGGENIVGLNTAKPVSLSHTSVGTFVYLQGSEGNNCMCCSLSTQCRHLGWSWPSLGHMNVYYTLSFVCLGVCHHWEQFTCENWLPGMSV